MDPAFGLYGNQSCREDGVRQRDESDFVVHVALDFYTLRETGHNRIRSLEVDLGGVDML